MWQNHIMYGGTKRIDQLDALRNVALDACRRRSSGDDGAAETGEGQEKEHRPDQGERGKLQPHH